MSSTLDDITWRQFGYPTMAPCIVCGIIGDNRIEPRFGYAICREHVHIAPTEIAKQVRQDKDSPRRGHQDNGC